ncbi:SDR family NAD(P)-dependent oxidoreductase [Actinoplanes sp. N902-109]|uniref:SDR family NAD(P)-dependent oxidoreductase n=1 Tax=Actinoplanes sp. (strain N902-109) TaxID=649831 RepID=UPI0003294EF7|nr:SDR family NAD(P)-dependent oxidoreductase [Actinoplanes sp. N902-109]AGL17417.1 putative short chain oxidoreductase [Actinoplanes sp. N902-109]
MTTITLITGANKGLGFEAARRLRELGHTVLVAARHPGRGRAAADRLDSPFVPLDVTDEGSVRTAADWVRSRYGRLDVLVNNAGIEGPTTPIDQATATDVAAVLDTNLLGVVRVTNAFLPLLRASAGPRIVNVSSGTGSFALTEQNSWWDLALVPPVYAVTKTALTKLTLCYAHALPGMRVNAADPGWTATDLNNFKGTQTVREGTDVIVELATVPPDGPTGTYVNRHGAVPW